MPFPQLDRSRLRIQPLHMRPNRVVIERDHVHPDAQPGGGAASTQVLGEVAARIHAARARNLPVVLATGAHTIKNGLGPVIIRLMEDGWLTHVATNGAGIIHDWASRSPAIP